jgi:ComF family protein
MSRHWRVPVCAACLEAPEPAQADHFCGACRTPFLNPRPLGESGLCYLCRHQVNRFDAAYSFGYYEGGLRELIHIFKYRGAASLAAPFARLLVRALPGGERFDAAVPVPLHWRRRWKRGFNQAGELADEFGRLTGIPVLHALRRTRPTSPQAGQARSARRKNMAGAFRVRGGGIAGKSLLLVDDVFTTGATSSACAAALKDAGARRVSVLTVARADRRAWADAFPEEGPRLSLAAAG